MGTLGTWKEAFVARDCCQCLWIRLRFFLSLMRFTNMSMNHKKVCCFRWGTVFPRRSVARYHAHVLLFINHIKVHLLWVLLINNVSSFGKRSDITHMYYYSSTTTKAIASSPSDRWLFLLRQEVKYHLHALLSIIYNNFSTFVEQSRITHMHRFPSPVAKGIGLIPSDRQLFSRSAERLVITPV